MSGADLSALVGARIPLAAEQDNARGDLMVLAHELVTAISNLHGQDDDDIAGLSLSAIRETGTGRILSVHLTPVDVVDGSPVPRYVTATEH